MNGQNKFNKHKFIINLICKLFGFLPLRLNEFLWDSITHYRSDLFCGLRYCLLRTQGALLGNNVYIGTNVIIKNPKNLYLGSNVSIHSFCYIDALGGLFIGDNVSVAHSCSFVAFNHGWENLNLPIKYNEIVTKGIKIGDDVWIGCGARVLDGVEIGRRVIIASGAVITKSFSSGVIVGGVPGKVIGKI